MRGLVDFLSNAGLELVLALGDLGLPQQAGFDQEAREGSNPLVVIFRCIRRSVRGTSGGNFLDQAFLELVPRILAGFVQVDDHSECSALPGCGEHRLAVAAGIGKRAIDLRDGCRVRWGNCHDAPPACAGVRARLTPTIESRVTRRASASSDIASVPAGRCGTTRYRCSALVSQT